MTYNVVLVSIITFAILSSFIGKFLSNKIFMGINRRLHDIIIQKVLYTGINFFEENTQGRILNRFSKDVATMDNIVFTVLEMADVSSTHTLLPNHCCLTLSVCITLCSTRLKFSSRLRL